MGVASVSSPTPGMGERQGVAFARSLCPATPPLCAADGSRYRPNILPHLGSGRSGVTREAAVKDGFGFPQSGRRRRGNESCLLP